MALPTQMDPVELYRCVVMFVFVINLYLYLIQRGNLGQVMALPARLGPPVPPFTPRWAAPDPHLSRSFSRPQNLKNKKSHLSRSFSRPKIWKIINPHLSRSFSRPQNLKNHFLLSWSRLWCWFSSFCKPLICPIRRGYIYICAIDHRHDEQPKTAN